MESIGTIYNNLENLKRMKFFVTFWISDHATKSLEMDIISILYALYANYYTNPEAEYYWYDAHLDPYWIRQAHSQTIIISNANQSFILFRLFYPDQPKYSYIFELLSRLWCCVMLCVLRKLKTTASSFDNSQSTLIYCAKISTNVLLR